MDAKTLRHLQRGSHVEYNGLRGIVRGFAIDTLDGRRVSSSRPTATACIERAYIITWLGRTDDDVVYWPATACKVAPTPGLTRGCSCERMA